MKQVAPLTKIQYGIYVESASHLGEICYNLPYLYTLDKSLDVERLCCAVETAVKAHPTLFTHITLNDEGEPMQIIGDGIDSWTLHVEDIDSIDAVKSELVMPFNLYDDLLFRIRLLRNAKHLYLFFDFHHIIMDGVSIKLLLNDMDKAYHSLALNPETISLA